MTDGNKLTLREGGWYERRDGKIVGPIEWEDTDGFYCCMIRMDGIRWHYSSNGHAFHGGDSPEDLIREVPAPGDRQEHPHTRLTSCSSGTIPVDHWPDLQNEQPAPGGEWLDAAKLLFANITDLHGVLRPGAIGIIEDALAEHAERIRQQERDSVANELNNTHGEASFWCQRYARLQQQLAAAQAKLEESDEEWNRQLVTIGHLRDELAESQAEPDRLRREVAEAVFQCCITSDGINYKMMNTYGEIKNKLAALGITPDLMKGQP